MQKTLQGKLKKTLPEKCIFCKVNLQLRILDVKVVSGGRYINEEIKLCPSCGNYVNIQPVKRRGKSNPEEE